MSAEALADFEVLEKTSFFREALERGDIVATERVEQTAPLPDRWRAGLRHERIPVVSYPYEWPFEMLRDASRLQLDLTRRSLAEGVITKDATPFNVQFVGSKPVFIDVGSFERIRPGEPWAGYRQFCEMFLNPLYIQAICDVPFGPLMRANIDGIPPRTAASLIGHRGWFQRGVLMHVRLHARLERRYADADREQAMRPALRSAAFGPKVIDAQLCNLRRAVDKLARKDRGSPWSGYGDRAHYTDRDLAAKEAFVADAVRRLSGPQLVLDLGANDGRFSRVAADAGARYSIAADSDELVVDGLYRELRDAGDRRILPLVLDLSNPSPGVGWRSRERAAFADRVRPDLTLCLAVVHHLALTNNVPLGEIVDFLADFEGSLVVEFPHRSDPMASRMLARKRTGLFDGYDIPDWERELGRHFVVRERTTLPSGSRTLYECQRR